VPLSLVVGPAFAIAAPFDRAGRLKRPGTFAKVPDPSEAPPKKAVIKPAGVSC
jgi:signal peptidase I